MAKHFYVYILASDRNGTLYTGLTNNLPRRITEHKSCLQGGFTARYKVTRLVWAERHDTFISAVTREKQIKTWNRKWKLRLIEENNPQWKDLSESTDQLFH